MNYPAGKTIKSLALSIAAGALMTVSAMAAGEDMAITAGATTGSSLRLREAPSVSSGILTHLDKDITVAVLSENTNGWYRVSYDGKTGYVSAAYLRLDDDNIFQTHGRVNRDSVSVRAGASADSKLLAALDAGTMVTITGLTDGWYAVTCKYGTKGYIRSDLLDMTAAAEVASGSRIAASAMQQLGVPYVWGGASPRGFDCSGFTRYVYQQHGYSMYHSASSQWLYGPGTRVWSIAALQPGDLVFFNDPSRNGGKACSHAGIYLGSGQFVHASSSKGRVMVSDLRSGYYNRFFVGGRHV